MSRNGPGQTHKPLFCVVPLNDLIHLDVSDMQAHEFTEVSKRGPHTGKSQVITTAIVGITLIVAGMPDRQACSQTDRQTDSQINKQAGRHAGKQADRQASRNHFCVCVCAPLLQDLHVCV